MKWKLIIIGGIVLVLASAFIIMALKGEISILNKGTKNLPSVVLASSYNPLDTRPVGYEYLDNNGNVVNEASGTIIHLWNNKDDYFIEKASGIQITNHFQEYWSKNIFCGQYYTNKWNDFCIDDLGLNWIMTTDNSTYVQLHGYNTLAGMGISLDYRLEYGWDSILIKPYLTNTGNKDIQDSTFIWKVQDIKIYNNQTDNTLEVYNGSWNHWFLDETDSLGIVDITNRTYYINKYPNNYTEFGIRMIWNQSKWVNNVSSGLDYTLNVTSETGQYNSPISLITDIGQINRGDDVYTYFYWKDPTYTLTGNYLFENDTSINEGVEKLKLSMQVTSDNKGGDWYLYVNTTPIAGGSARIVNGTCDTGDSWKIVSITSDDTVCKGTHSVSTGRLACDTNVNTGTANQTFVLETCTGSVSGTPYTFYSHCVEDSPGTDVCSGFPDNTNQVTVIPPIPSFTNLNANDSEVFPGDLVNHSVTVSSSPSHYIFSWNASGVGCNTWVNSSVIPISGVSTTAWNQSIIPSACADKVIGWRFYANNSGGANSSSTDTYDVYSYGTLQVNLTKPDEGSGYYTLNTNLTMNATITCNGGANAKCGTVSAYAMYNESGATPDILINITDDTPFYLQGGGSSNTEAFWRPVSWAGSGIWYNLENAVDKRYNDTTTGAGFGDIGGNGTGIYTYNLTNNIQNGKIFIRIKYQIASGDYNFVSIYNYTSGQWEYWINPGDIPSTSTIYSKSISNGYISSSGQVKLNVSGHSDVAPNVFLYDTYISTSGNTYDYWGVSNPSVLSNASYGTTASDCINLDEWGSSLSEISAQDYLDVNQSDNNDLTIPGAIPTSYGCGVFNFKINESVSNIDYIGTYFEGGTMGTEDGKIYFYNFTSDSWQLVSTWNTGSVDTDELFNFMFNSSLDGFINDNYYHFMITAGRTTSGSNSANIDYIRTNVIGGAGASNPQSSPTTLSYGESFYPNWTLNVTSTSTEDYLVGIKFNSSYGSALVPDNYTTNRTVKLNPGGAPPSGTCWQYDTASKMLSIPTGCVYNGTGAMGV